jgi:hypothetical protein
MQEVAAIKKLRLWLGKRGFGLRYGNKTNEVCFTAKKVTLQRSLARHAKIATLLHECGHVLVYLNRRKTKQSRVAGLTWDEWWKTKPKSKNAKLLMMHEEFLAWERGYRLGRRMKVNLPTALKRNVQTRALMSYCRFIALS